MLGFSKKTVKEPVVNSTTLSGEIDSIVKTFTTMIDNLRSKANKAEIEKSKKAEEIKVLQQECDNLTLVSSRATKMADKIANIFCEQDSEK